MRDDQDEKLIVAARQCVRILIVADKLSLTGALMRHGQQINGNPAGEVLALMLQQMLEQADQAADAHAALSSAVCEGSCGSFNSR